MSADLAIIRALGDEALDALARRLAPRLQSLFPGPEPDRWLTSREAAKHLGLSLAEVHRRAKAGEIPSVQDHGPNGTRYYLRSDLDAWRRGV